MASGAVVEKKYPWSLVEKKHDTNAWNIVGIIDAAIFMHPTTWKASGHVDSFSDPMIDNKDNKNAIALTTW